MVRQMTDVAFRGGTLRTRRRRRARRGVGLGEYAFEFFEGEQELVGVELLGLLGEHRAAQLAQQMFKTPVVLGERGHPAAQALDWSCPVSVDSERLGFHVASW